MTALYFIDGAPLRVPTLEAYARNPAPFDAEIAANRALCNAAIDHGMRHLNQRQAARWAAEGEK